MTETLREAGIMWSSVFTSLCKRRANRITPPPKGAILIVRFEEERYVCERDSPRRPSPEVVRRVHVHTDRTGGTTTATTSTSTASGAQPHHVHGHPAGGQHQRADPPDQEKEGCNGPTSRGY
ncbi:hypothetical protein BDZ91DRAFT_733490 [Kalaharituber pfeilii]|nr:hypothetical protein BDZ91DRAFT_733490 [Kalaharituber pfeilii]